jgi:hypothetical protein
MLITATNCHKNAYFCDEDAGARARHSFPFPEAGGKYTANFRGGGAASAAESALKHIEIGWQIKVAAKLASSVVGPTDTRPKAQRPIFVTGAPAQLARPRSL